MKCIWALRMLYFVDTESCYHCLDNVDAFVSVAINCLGSHCRFYLPIYGHWCKFQFSRQSPCCAGWVCHSHLYFKNDSETCRFIYRIRDLFSSSLHSSIFPSVSSPQGLLFLVSIARRTGFPLQFHLPILPSLPHCSIMVPTLGVKLLERRGGKGNLTTMWWFIHVLPLLNNLSALIQFSESSNSMFLWGVFWLVFCPVFIVVMNGRDGCIERWPCQNQIP